MVVKASVVSARTKGGKTPFLSDLMSISKGLVTLISSIYSNETAEEIANSDIDLMEEFELGVILSPARRNGAYSMLKLLKNTPKVTLTIFFPPRFMWEINPYFVRVFCNFLNKIMRLKITFIIPP